MPLQLNSSSAEETHRLGTLLGTRVRAGDVIGLSGDLGAGKTSFVRGVAAGLAVPEKVLVTSPTFTLVNEYPGRLTLFHADLYRLHGEDDLVEIGLVDEYGGKGVVIVEWCERFLKSWPQESMRVSFRVVDATCRELTLQAQGPRHHTLLNDWMASANPS